MAQCVEIDRGMLFPVSGNSADCALVLMSGSDYARLGELLNQNPDSIDYAECGAIFSFFFGVTLGLWLLAKQCGILLHFVRKS